MISWLVNSTSVAYSGERIIFGAYFLPCYNTALLDGLHTTQVYKSLLAVEAIVYIVCCDSGTGTTYYVDFGRGRLLTRASKRKYPE